MLAAVDTAYIFERLLLSLCLVLVLGRFAAIGCRRIGLPVVIGELLVGIALGPSLLGLLAPDLRDDLFPADVLPYLNVVSQLGLVLFMFLVGLELDLDMVKRSGRRAVTISLCSITVPFVLGTLLLGSWLHGAHDCVPIRDAAVVIDDADVCTPSADQEVSGTVVGYQKVDQLAFSLFIGVSICGTAFAILARILAERNMFRIPLGLTLVACAAVDDIVAFALLAVILTVVTGSSLVATAQTLLLMVLFTVALFKVVRPVLQRLVVVPFQRDAKLLPEHLAILLAGLFASALFTQAIGVSTILGAFLYGAAIPRPTEASIFDDVAERLDGIAVTLLLPVFFVITGQNVRINELQASDILPALGIIAVASLGKFIGGAASARFTGVPRRQSLAVGVLMNTRGLAELVILQLGSSLGVLDDRMFTMLVVMAVATTTISAPLLRLVYPERWLARDIAEADRRRSSTHSERVAIIIPSGVDAAADPSVDHALELAIAYGAARETCAVTLIHMVPASEGVGGVAEAMGTMRGLQRRVTDAGPSCLVVSRAANDPGQAAVAEIQRLSPDIAITIDGSLTDALVALGTDVATVSPDVSPTRARDGIGLATDGGLNEQAAVEVAARLALHASSAFTFTNEGSGRMRRDLARAGVRLTADAAPSVIAAPRSGAANAGPIVAVVSAGHRDRESLSERLKLWQDVAPVVPLTSL